MLTCATNPVIADVPVSVGAVNATLTEALPPVGVTAVGGSGASNPSVPIKPPLRHAIIFCLYYASSISSKLHKYVRSLFAEAVTASRSVSSK